MEEEIITPEEEVFDYHKLRYILNSDGYVHHASLGGLIVCDLGECTEYNGEIPSGYETIEEWLDSEIDKLNAWKIVDGNLLFDENKYAELNARCKQEEIDNSPVYHHELYGLQQKIEEIQDISNSRYSKSSATGKVIFIKDVIKTFPKIKITDINPYIFNKIDLISTGKNMLFNDAATQTIAGVEFRQNEDRSITINGTSTENIEYPIGGTSSNTIPFLCFKKGLDYFLSSNNYQIKMYNFDGTDRTEVYSGTGGIINFTDENKVVTQIVLCIPSGTTIEDVTIYPQLEFGNSASEYETFIYNQYNIDFSEYIEEELFPSDTLFPSDSLFPKGTTVSYILIENKEVKALINDKEINLGSLNVSIFDGSNTIYTIQDAVVEIEYCVNVLDVTDLDFMIGKSTSTKKFKVLEDGSIEAHNGYFSGNLKLNDNGVPSSSALIVTTKLDPNVETSDNGITTVLGNRFEIKGEGIFEGEEQYITGYLHSGIASFFVTGDVWANSFENMSLLEKKKNITPFKNGLELVKNADLYKFNYKNENDEHKKHIGLIINEDYNTPNEVVSNSKESIDIYSMISVAWQSIKELNSKIETLEERIKELESDK